MNKNFEEAYKAEVQQNIPDLWNRIESSLPEKSPVQNVTEKQEVQPVTPAPAKKNKKKNPYAWIKWASLAAACLLVLMIVPAVIGVGLIGMVSNEETAAADMAATETYYEEAAPEMEAAEEETVYMDSLVEEDKDYAPQEAPDRSEMLQEDLTEDAEAGYVGQGAAPEADVNTAVSETGYYELVIGGLFAEVTGINEQEDFYEVVVEFSEMSRLVADELFGESVYYSDGSLHVRVYPGKGEIPVIGGKYSVDIYNVTPPVQSLIMPYSAELTNSSGE